MTLEYNEQTAYTATIQIDDIGNTALRCITENNTTYYIATDTYMGKVRLLKFGPLLEETGEMGREFNLTRKIFDYKEPVILKELNTFIQDYKKKVISVTEISSYEMLKYLPEPDSYLTAE